MACSPGSPDVTATHRRYVAIEATIGAVISGVLSVAFCVLIFGRASRVSAFGTHSLAVDALPQTFMITLMASLVPTLLTRARVRRGTQMAWHGVSVRLPRNVALRAVLVAMAVTVVGGIATCACLFAGPSDYASQTVLVAKTVYGILLGGGVAAFATRLALSDQPA